MEHPKHDGKPSKQNGKQNIENDGGVVAPMRGGRLQGETLMEAQHMREDDAFTSKPMFGLQIFSPRP